MVVVLALASTCKNIWPDQRELSRKIVHIGTGAVIPLAWQFSISRTLALCFAVTVTVLTAINHRWRLIPAVEDVDRQSYGTVAYGLSITILLLLFWPERADAVCAGVLVMALGDGLAGLIGRHWTSPRWTLWNQTKSVAGTLTMATASLFSLMALSWRVHGTVPLAATVVITLVAVGLEQLSYAGIDNFTVPLAVAVLWSL